MAVVTLRKISVTAKLDNGTDSQGKARTVNLKMSGISKDTYVDDKMLAVVSALEPCLSKTVNSVEKAVTSTVSAS